MRKSFDLKALAIQQLQSSRSAAAVESTMSWNRSSYVKYPEFKQRSGMTREQIDALVARLNTSKPTDEHNNEKRKAMSKPLSQEQLADMLERLANGCN